MRHKRQLGIQTKPNNEWREELGLLKPAKDFPFIRKGWPVFEKPYDPKHKLLPPSYRQYQKPAPPQPKVDRDPNGHAILVGQQRPSMNCTGSSNLKGKGSSLARARGRRRRHLTLPSTYISWGG